MIIGLTTEDLHSSTHCHTHTPDGMKHIVVTTETSCTPGHTATHTHTHPCNNTVEIWDLGIGDEGSDGVRLSVSFLHFLML